MMSRLCLFVYTCMHLELGELIGGGGGGLSLTLMACLCCGVLSRMSAERPRGK